MQHRLSILEAYVALAALPVQPDPGQSNQSLTCRLDAMSTKYTGRSQLMLPGTMWFCHGADVDLAISLQNARVRYMSRGYAYDMEQGHDQRMPASQQRVHLNGTELLSGIMYYGSCPDAHR